MLGTAVDLHIMFLDERLIKDGKHFIDPGILGIILRDLVEMVRTEHTDEIIGFTKLFDRCVHKRRIFCPNCESTPRIFDADTQIIFGVCNVYEITVTLEPGNAGIDGGNLIIHEIMAGKLLCILGIAGTGGFIDFEAALGVAVSADAGFILGTFSTDGIAHHTGGDGWDAFHFALRMRDKNLFDNKILLGAHMYIPFLMYKGETHIFSFVSLPAEN